MAFRILALSGGGFLGLFSAQVLANLEKKSGRPIGEGFDLIAGTSIGGVIALGLALGIPAASIRDAFEARGAQIFSARSKPSGAFATFVDFASRYLFTAKYRAEGLRSALVDMFGSGTLLGHAKHPVIVPTVNMTRGEIQFFKTPHHINFSRDHLLSVVDVAMATAAAPTYFPLANVGDWLCADGGLFANSPDLCAVHEAVEFLGAKRSEVEVLSIGTTTAKFSLSHRLGGNFGAWQWMSSGKLISSMLSSQQQMTDHILRHELGDRYIRIDELQSEYQSRDLGLDVATPEAQKTIRGLADGATQKALVNPKLDEFLNAAARRPLFFFGPRRFDQV